MITRYSASTRVFYPLDIDYGSNLPADVIEVSIDDYNAAMARPADHDFDFVDGQLVISKPAPVVEPLADMIARLSAAVDSLVKAIYERFTAFKVAYDPREAAARAFKAAGYTGDPGLWVTGFAVPAKLSNQQAADRIIAQADAAYDALPLIDAQRMRKYQMATADSAANVQALYDDIVAQINKQAAGLA